MLDLEKDPEYKFPGNAADIIALKKIISKLNQRTNGPVNARLIFVPTVSTKTSKIGQG